MKKNILLIVYLQIILLLSLFAIRAISGVVNSPNISATVNCPTCVSGTSIDITDNNPNWGGAKCDGSTDDTSAIRTTLNYAGNNNIPTVTAPPGATCLMRTTSGGMCPGSGSCNAQIPSQVTFKGGSGTIIDGNGFPVFNLGTHFVVWKGSLNGPYKVNNTTTGNTFIDLTTASDANNFAVGDIVAWYYWRPRHDQCSVSSVYAQSQGDPCDVVPMQVEQISGKSGARLSFIDSVARTWGNGDGNAAPGSANCTAATGNPCSTIGVCSNCLSAIECASNGPGCTVVFPSGATEIVAFNITSLTYRNCGLDTMTVRGPNPYLINQTYNCGFNNVNLLQNGVCGANFYDNNSVEHGSFSNVVFDVGPGAQIPCNTRSVEWFQRGSGNNLFNNARFGDSAGNWIGDYSAGEVSYNNTYQNSTFYLINVPGGGCAFGDPGASTVIKTSTLNILNNNGVCSVPSATLTNSTIADNVFAPPPATGTGTGTYYIHQVIDSNTIQCYGDSSYECLSIGTPDTQVTSNHFFNLAGSSPAAIVLGIQGIPNNVNWSTNDFHFNNGTGTGTGISLIRGGPINGSQINGNQFFGSGGTAINISTGNSSGCSISNNTPHANMSVSISTGSPGCTVTNN